MLTYRVYASLPGSKVLHDLSPLCALTKLSALDLSFSECLTNEDLSVLKDCPRLVSLNLMYVSGLEDVRFLSSFTQLEVLDIQATKVKSLSPLVNCISLKQIDLRGTGVSDLSPLTRCTGLVKIKFKKWPQQEEAEWQGRKMSGGQRLASLVRQQ